MTRRNARHISALRKSAIVGASQSLIIIVGVAHGNARAARAAPSGLAIYVVVARNTPLATPDAGVLKNDEPWRIIV